MVRLDQHISRECRSHRTSPSVKHTCVHVALALLLIWTTPVAFGQIGPEAALETAREVDDFILHVFASEDTARYDAAVDAFYDLLKGDVRISSQDDRDVQIRHLRSTLRVMPAEARPVVSDEHLAESDLSEPGDAAAAWWRRQDPFPGTRHNERLEEHLARMAYAVAAFDVGGSQEADARADIFMRYGPPAQRVVVQLQDIIRAFDIPNSVSMSALPDNEFWVYPHVHDEAHFFFVRHTRRGAYRLGQPSELIPRRLRTGLEQRTERGKQKTELLLLVLEEVYARLALAHDFYGSTLDRIASYRGRPPSRSQRPEQFARSALGEAVAREMEASGRRDRLLPPAYSNVKESIEALPVELRWSRFLEPDGSTRVEIHWRVDPRSIPEPEPPEKAASDLYLLSIAVMRSTPDYRMLDLERTHYGVRPAEHAVLPVQSFVVDGHTDTVHLGLQWDVHRAVRMGGEVQPYGASLKRGTATIDSVAALHGRGERFEMSDLKPILVTSTAGHHAPYTASRFDELTPPQLYFELYNLHFGSDDRTRYSIAYEVVRDRAAQRTTAQSTYSGSDRSTEEIIEIALGDAASSGPVRINVRVTDEVTGEEIMRFIRFDL